MGRKSPDINFRHPRKLWVCYMLNNNLSDLLQAIYQKQFDDVSLGANQGILSDICSYSKEKVAVSELNVNTYFSTENMLPEKAGSTIVAQLSRQKSKIFIMN